MQYRPKLWIAMLLALLVVSFEIGFQPIRFIRHQQTTEATIDIDLGEPAAADEEALAAKLPELRKQLEDGGLKAIQEARFLDPKTLRVVTTALDETQRVTDQGLAVTTLQKTYKSAKAVEGGGQQSEQLEGLVTRLGPIGVFRPVPQVRLGLDLQGGAHVVLQCKPSTEMTYATPEDRPLYSDKPAPTPEGDAEAEEPAAKGGDKAEAPEASSGTPKYTKDALVAKVQETLTAAGVEKCEVTAPAPHRLLIRTQTTSQEAVDRERAAVLSFLQAEYPGVKIDSPEPISVFVTRDTAEKAKHIIDMRVYSMSDIKEPLVQTQGDDRIIVELPGVKDPERVTKILRSTAQLEFRLVPERYSAAGAAQDDYTVWSDSQSGQTVTEQRVLAESEVKFTGADLKPNASVVPGDVPSTFEVRFEIKESRKSEFATFTRNSVGRIMSIVLDGETKMAPVIRSEIPGAGVISGDMDAQEAGDLRLLLNAGALPVPLEIAENRQVSATLGADSIRQSLLAGLVGFGIVVVFMVVYYRLPGLLADIALVLYTMMLIATLSSWSPVQTIMTLPGIAGIILSIGMAVDSNVIIFERIKEELRHRTTTRAAVEAGFHRAWTAILDANVTTLLVCGALYGLGTSSVKSFAVSLVVGVVVSLFTAVTASRWLLIIVARTSLGENRWLLGAPPVTLSEPTVAGGSE